MGCAIHGASASTRLTGDLYIGDVGQAAWEEIDFQPAGDPGGENYGWNAYEATHPYSGAPAPANMTLPIAEYSHFDGSGIAVTGGYVYRGSALPQLDGVYFYGDLRHGQHLVSPTATIPVRGRVISSCAAPAT